jgi:hypothetical protein
MFFCAVKAIALSDIVDLNCSDAWSYIPAPCCTLKDKGPPPAYIIPDLSTGIGLFLCVSIPGVILPPLIASLIGAAALE